MKTRLRLSFCSAFIAGYFAGLALACAQGTAFTYQGLLSTGTNPATGNYDLRFYIYNAATGGSILAGPITNAPVPVTNGLFLAQLDFGPGVFTGSSNWLQIGVRPYGSAAAYTGLSPRQQLTPAPYAMFAESANSAGLTGTVPNGSLPADVALLNANQTFTGNNNFSGNIDLLDPTTTILFPATSGANSPMMAMFSSGTDNADRMVIAHSLAFPNWGIQYQDSSDTFNFLEDGIPVFTVGLGSESVWAIGNFGVGTANPAQQYLSVHGGENIDQANDNGGYINNGLSSGYGLTFGGNSGEGIGSQRTAGIGNNQYGLDFYTDFTHRMTITQSGLVGIGIGTNYPSAALEVAGEYLVVDGLTPVRCYIGDDGSGNDVQIGSQKSGVTALAAYNTADNAYMHFYCSSITIQGGADLAEPFTITAGRDDVPQGAVVVIDEVNPGHLKMSDQDYDTHVAGVVSGANGINPGIQMQQQGLLEGGKNVALTGRVYVRADASNGAIKPGDMLTTSTIPGDAMKVTDHARAAGAILGKAMTGLTEGRGMVLVLVTLQ